MKSKYEQLRISRKNTHHKTNNCGVLVLLDYISNENCTVQFLDGTILYNVKYGDITRGEVKNKNYPSVFGFGYLGYGKYSFSKHKNIYKIWSLMIQRCYSGLNPSYIECIVCKDWLNFQKFAYWYDRNFDVIKNNKFHLDKDILIKGNKIYSPETCCFVPSEINKAFVKNNVRRGDLPIGVRGKLNIEKQFLKYKEKRESHIKILANKWKSCITEKVYNALINYKVEITD